MRRFLGEIPWIYLLPISLLLAAMPVSPEPHLVEKIRMLMNGQLSRPVDIFDLVLHGGLLLLVVMKLLLGITNSWRGGPYASSHPILTVVESPVAMPTTAASKPGMTCWMN